jgi:hypothetical protein
LQPSSYIDRYVDKALPASLPVLIPLLFILTTIATRCFFYWTLRNASIENVRRKAVPILLILIAWLIVQAAALRHIYSATINANPPKLMLFGFFQHCLLY